MSSHKTPDEVRQDYIQVMGKGLGELYYILWNELSWLYLKWNEYIELFDTKPSRIDLMNRTAGQFFRIVNDALLGDCLLHIARLTDPPQSSGKDNFTITRLPDMISDENLKERIEELIKIVGKDVEFCRQLRHKLLAHMDLYIALGTRVEPLEPPSRDKIENALKSIADVMNLVNSHYFRDSHISFEFIKFMPNPSGAKALLRVIHNGLKTQEERDRRIEAGEILADGSQEPDI